MKREDLKKRAKTIKLLAYTMIWMKEPSEVERLAKEIEAEAGAIVAEIQINGIV